ncbi:STAS domain-containing protein [Desulfurispirillum indicum]|uniref:Anti-sigma factor antagonist n=1 Tax=Desulfurispirillum indicum (strain ATCC BAA-1389 / DSM 22839 / S5) TaxID=653733 RepID=E6W1U5_DESIS|nr:STAS domain-containing protein [Desulfurispirillum indicum]ADU65477.1 anti-anti-sigma factor [Desulfurispirillum indicum S5]UCZ57397.1 STAS domain-containing protein [Desulfurispirillum indicum]
MNKTVKNGVLVYQLAGEIEAKAGKALSSQIKTDLGSVAPSALLNFQDVTYMNSAGLRELIDIVKYCNKSGHKLKISNLPEDIREMFEFTNLTRVFAIFDTESQALASY